MIHAIRMRQLVGDCRTTVFLLVLSLAHGLVASSLLVECIPADGSSLIELVGQDPCHQPFGSSEPYYSRQPAATPHMDNDATDPCVDLSLEGFGISAAVQEIHPPAAAAADALAGLSPAAGATCLVHAAGKYAKQAREPGEAAEFYARLHTSLRI